MNKKQRPSQKKKGAAVAAVVCFVAAIALVGTYTFNDYKRTQEKEQLALAEEEDDTKDKKEPAEEANNLVINNKEKTEPEVRMSSRPRETAGRLHLTRAAGCCGRSMAPLL